MTQIDWSNRKPDMADLSFLHYDADKDTIINDDEKFQLISVKTKNPSYIA